MIIWRFPRVNIKRLLKKWIVNKIVGSGSRCLLGPEFGEIILNWISRFDQHSPKSWLHSIVKCQYVANWSKNENIYFGENNWIFGGNCGEIECRVWVGAGAAPGWRRAGPRTPCPCRGGCPARSAARRRTAETCTTRSEPCLQPCSCITYHAVSSITQYLCRATQRRRRTSPCPRWAAAAGRRRSRTSPGSPSSLSCPPPLPDSAG